MDDRELLKIIFDQHWLHARHVETERLALLSVYAVICSGCLAAFKEAFFTRDALGVHVFLILLALICLLACIKLGALFDEHTRRANNLFSKEVLPKDVPTMLPLFPKGHWATWKIFRVRLLFPSFFLLCLFALLWIVFFPKK